MNNSKELIKTYKEYIELLEEELNELAILASIRGWKSYRFEAGKKLRDKIKELENEKNTS